MIVSSNAIIQTISSNAIVGTNGQNVKMFIMNTADLPILLGCLGWRIFCIVTCYYVLFIYVFYYIVDI